MKSPVNKPDALPPVLTLAPWPGKGKQPERESVRTIVENLVARGLRVVPVYGLDNSGRCTCHRGRACKSPGKHPNPSFNEATTERSTIAHWFATEAFENVGVACGAFGSDTDAAVFVLDIDARHNGFATLEQWTTEHGRLPRTLEVDTGGGGKHFYFRVPAAEQIRNSAGVLGEGVDVRGHGGFVVVPPSLHPSGKHYEFAANDVAVAIADAPEWLLQRIRASRRASPRKYDADVVKNRVATTDITVRQSLAAKALAKHPVAVEDGTGERTTFAAASIGYAFGLELEEFLPLIEEYNQDKCDPPWESDELYEKVAHAYRYNDHEFPFGWRLTPASEIEGRRVLVYTLHDAENVDRLLDALADDDTVFVNNSRLARLVLPVDAPPRAEPYGPITLQDDASRIATWVTDGKNAEPKSHRPPRDLFEMAVSRRSGFGRLRVLRAVVEHPFFRPDGSLVSAPGFDDITGVYLSLPRTFEMDSTAATRDDAESAWKTLRDVVDEFPFRGEVDRAAWLALVLTPFLKFAFDGVVPLFLIEATTPGTGKGLLLDVVSRIATGRVVPRAMLAMDQGEQRKAITSILIQGARMVVFDNVVGGIGGPVIEGLLTAQEWSDRMLGRNENVHLRNDAIWCASANNVRIEGDASRRIVGLRLEPQVERPENRVFKRPNLAAHIMAERDTLMRAALTICSAYFNAGAPRANKIPLMGSFEGWHDVVVQCAFWMTGVDPTGNRDHLLENDADRELCSEILAAMEPLGVVSATEMASGIATDEHEYKRLRDAMAELLPTRSSGPITANQIGRQLASMKGRIFGGRRLQQQRDKKSRGWTVERVVSASDDKAKAS